ncbi:MAG TPA: hypothetical protein VNF69_03820 [Burkholderiales bacterium]|nr:hypothetical protein [Burkholderiales bacterium]
MACSPTAPIPLVLALAERAFDLLAARSVFVGLEGCRNAGAQVLDQALHALPEPGRLAGRQQIARAAQGV